MAILVWKWTGERPVSAPPALQCLGWQIRCFHFQEKRRSDALHI